MTTLLEPIPPISSASKPSTSGNGPRRGRHGNVKSAVSLLAQGEPMVWLTGGGLALCVLMILGLLGLVLYQGFSTFWPQTVERWTLTDGRVIAGEINREETYIPQSQTTVGDAAGKVVPIKRWLLRTGNFDLTGEHFTWVLDTQIKERSQPQWMIVVERMAWGRFYGEPKSFRIDGREVAAAPQAVWEEFEKYHQQVRERWQQGRGLEIHDIGRISHRQDEARLAVRQAELSSGADSPQTRAATEDYLRIKAEAENQFNQIREQINALTRENNRYEMVLVTSTGQEKTMQLAEVVLAYPANRLSIFQRLGVYLERWREFLLDNPREANSEGGVFPALFGTVMMTMVMSLAVVPFGVLAALYLREYAKAGPLISAIRIAVNNLAGVPSIVFGVFGLYFFCYTVGGGIDHLFFAAKLPSPTFGTGGIFWASLTLALLTLPVVIVATEEALAAVPGSMREGSYACGASKWQTIQRIVLPRAMPGIMTGMILAMARGAGEVAPLMLVGAVKLAPELPLDGIFPYVHPERSFMHLGFHIYDLGFQSQNSEAAKPMVFTTTLLLIVLVASLNVAAVWIRTRLRRKFRGSQF